MEPKKNIKSDVSRNSSLYFAVGMVLMLALTYMTINYKTFEKDAIDIGQLDLDALDEEDIPITDQTRSYIFIIIFMNIIYVHQFLV